MKYPKLRELVEAIKALIMGPYTSKFPFKPHQPFERFRGKPTPDDEWCIGCDACFSVCPASAIEIVDDAKEGLEANNRWSGAHNRGEGKWIVR